MEWFEQIAPMRVNRGGNLAPDEVVGRDQLIARLWKTLERQSVVLSAERRMGKTSVIKKMVAQPVTNARVVYTSVEKVRTPIEFVATVLKDVDKHLSGGRRVLNRVHSALSKVEGFKVGEYLQLPKIAAPQWKSLLESAFQDLMEHQKQDGAGSRAVYFFWDEVPFMLDNIKRDNGATGEALAEDVLNTLRHQRQTHDGLRMAFTGSVGLHHVLTAMRREGYGNAPVNDMLVVDVPALTPNDAARLALSLLTGENIQTAAPQAAALQIAAAVDNIPFFIHHVIGTLADNGETADGDAAKRIVTECLTSPQDPWTMRYYEERISHYYPGSQGKLALVLLDTLATTAQPLSVDRLFTLAQTRLALDDERREEVREVLTLLQRDHYAARDENGAYGFRFPIIARAWRLNRGL